VPDAIEKTRNLSKNAVAWAEEVFQNVTLVQFAREAPIDILKCCCDVEGCATQPWEFHVYVPNIPSDIDLQNDDNIEKVENWLDKHIHNMRSWAERT
jgi:hypothetical protein